MNEAASKLLGLDGLAAVFKPGQSALGHHWVLQSPDGEALGRTKLQYEGSGKTVGRLLRATGLSTSGTTHAAVLGSDGEVMFTLTSRPGKEAHVMLSSAEGAPIGLARRRDLSLDLIALSPESPVGTIARESREDQAFAVQDLRGERVAVLSKAPLQVSAPSIYNMVFLPQVASNQIAFQATMHLGFAGSREYHVAIERPLASDALRTLVVLAPVLAAYAY